jgi:hypothetical protein
MSRAPARRAHLVSPFGTGALLVSPDGTSMAAAGLDHWYEREGEGRDTQNVDVDEYRIEEWRLERRLGVSHFRLPPDWRRPRRGRDIPNVGLTVPFLRFPRWHFCWRCKRLADLPLTATGRRKCEYCLRDGKTSFLAQVPFLAMCDGGHLQDFPWREWVHRSATPTCKGTLSLIATGGATLANQMVMCECGERRTLSQIVEASADGTRTHLSSTLEPGTDAQFLCAGASPQHGTTTGKGCPRPLRGSLRSASNLYFGVVRSAIYLPRSGGGVPAELLTIVQHPDLIDIVMLLHDAGREVPAERLRRSRRKELQPYKDDEIERAIELAITAHDDLPEEGEYDGDEQAEWEFRMAEAAVLREEVDANELTVRRVDRADYGSAVSAVFARIRLVERLRETRVLAGFNRVFPEQQVPQEERMAQLWEEVPARQDAWLPGYCVFGEGLYFELDEALVQDWEARPAVIQQAAKLQGLYAAVQAQRHLRERDLTARYLLVHTLAHVLMNQLTFECGYSSAALRERLYVSDEPASPLAAVLIYTAAGDAEGTMGGLVRMGGPGYLERVLADAISQARWCAADPVCMEIGSSTGQGPDSCNLAACHSCGLVPETACEEFNRFLDRGVLVGTLDSPDLAFFDARVQPTA